MLHLIIVLACSYVLVWALGVGVALGIEWWREDYFR